MVTRLSVCVEANRLRAAWYGAAVQLYPVGKLGDEHLSELERYRCDLRSQEAMHALQAHLASCEVCLGRWDGRSV